MNGRLIAGVTSAAAVAAGGTYLMHEGGGDHMWRFPYDQDEHVVDYTTNLTQVGDAYNGSETYTALVEGGPTTLTEEQPADGSVMPYARRYDRDPMADAIDIEKVEATLQRVQELRDAGWTEITVYVEGHASAEDDTPGPDAGVRTPHAGNQALTSVRSEAESSWLREHGVNSETIEGEEDSFTQAEYDDLAETAAKYDIHDINTAIDLYNANYDLPDELSDTLYRLLDLNRVNKHTIIASRNAPGGIDLEQKTREVCVVPVHAQTTEHIDTTPREVGIPKFFPPVVVAANRSRRNRAVIPYVTSPAASAPGAGEIPAAGHLALVPGGEPAAQTESSALPVVAPEAAAEQPEVTPAPAAAPVTEASTARERRQRGKWRYGIGPVIVGGLAAAAAVTLPFFFIDGPDADRTPGYASADDACDADAPVREDVVSRSTREEFDR